MGLYHAQGCKLQLLYCEYMNEKQVGFIGQGFIGKNMADEFEMRGYEAVRYALEEPYRVNKDRIADCPVTFIAVPTPTTPDGFDFSIIRDGLQHIGAGNTAVIKSTILPGTTETLQAEFPDIVVMHSPEFLRETSAAEDTAHPERNIVGYVREADRPKAERVLALLPSAPFNLVTAAQNAECIKYIGNTFLYTKLVFMNMAHDFTKVAGADWETVRDAVAHDTRIGSGHTNVIQDSGRGAGGHCFIKDYEALVQYYDAHANDPAGSAALKAYRDKNTELLTSTGKDLSLLRGVYGNLG